MKKLSNIDGIINEKALGDSVEKYIKAKKAKEMFLFDMEYRNKFINTCIETGVLNIDNEDNVIMYDDVNYTSEYAMFIWQEIWLKLIDYSLQEYNMIEALNKMKIN